jgi:TonB family protein
MARAAPLTLATTASLALHVAGLTLVAGLLQQVPAGAYTAPIAIVARLVESQPEVREAPKRAPKKRAAADAATVAQFRQQFISSAARYLDYPAGALGAEAQGEVVVSVSFAAGRAAADVRVKRSSGHHLLDAQALDMFRHAAAAMALPSALRALDFEFEVPVVYALKR